MNINAKGSLQGVVTARQLLSGEVAEKTKLIGNVNVGGSIMPEVYEGDYSVIPEVTAQTLPTKEKFMVEDVTIKEIPYAEVTNLANGITVTIGKEV